MMVESSCMSYEKIGRNVDNKKSIRAVNIREKTMRTANISIGRAIITFREFCNSDVLYKL